MREGLRVDVVLHRLRLMRSRSEAKAACEAGAVFVDGKAARPSELVGAGDRLSVRFPRRHLEIELLALPGKSLSKQAARETFRTLRDEETRPVE